MDDLTRGDWITISVVLAAAAASIALAVWVAYRIVVRVNHAGEPSDE